MLTSWRLIVTVAGIFIVALVLSVLTIRKGNKAQLAFPVALSITALIVSIVGVFKAELFPFNLRVFLGEIHIVKTSEDNSTTPGFLLPLDFLNTGYGEGFVEDLIVRMTTNGQSFCIRPACELDYQQFVRDKGKLTFGNLGDSFVGFPLGSKAATRKSLLFFKQGPKFDLQAGTNASELFVLSTASSTPRLMLRFSFPLRDADIETVKAGSFGIINRIIEESDLPDASKAAE